MSLLLLFNHHRAYQAKTGWSISARSNSQVLVTFASMGRVNADQDTRWLAYGTTGGTPYSTSWSQQRLSGTNSRLLEWNQAAVVTATRALVWDDLDKATSSQSLSWFYGGWVFSEATAGWFNMEPTSSTLQMGWTASQTAPADPVAMAWAASQLAALQAALPWQTSVVASRTLQMEWFNLGYVTSPLIGLVWSALVAVQGPTVAMLWSASQVAQAVDQVLLWRADGLTFSDVQTRWTSSGPAVALLQIVWDALLRVSKDELLLWGATAYVPNPFLGAMLLVQAQIPGEDRLSSLGPAAMMETTTRSMEGIK